jgi:hypothetical protein
MYSKQQASQLRQQFWTTFGQYMAPILSAEEEKINWINYKTGEKDLAFRMHADNKKASIGIELTHKDKEIQQIYFEQLLQLKTLLSGALQEDWQWQLHNYDEQGRTVSRVFIEKPGVSIYQKKDWPELISFFKPRIIALDAFWCSAKYTFENLR